MKGILLIIVLSISSICLGQEKITSFRGLDWGLQYSEVKDQLEPVKTRTTKGLKPFKKIDEVLVFEGIEVENILYLFKKEKFVAATVAMHNDNLDSIISIFEKKYGEPKFTDAFILKNYEWHMPSAIIVVTITPSASDGIGLLVQINGK